MIALAAEWDRIRRSGQGDGRLEVPSRATGVSTGYGEVRLATGPQGEARLLVPVARPGRGRMPPGNQSLLVSYASYRNGSQVEHFIDLMLRDARLAGVFADLAEEILSRIGVGTPPDTAVKGTIDDFRKLLAAGPIGEVPANKIAGLIGELLVLDQLCAHDPAMVDAWVGPTGQRHDFRRGALAIETKTSMRSDATKIAVHGGEQLQAPLGSALFLAHIRAERADKGDLTVASIFSRIVGRGADEVLLEDRLHAVGCRAPDAEEWNEIAFSLEGFDIYAVNKNFPRIIPEIFPAGVLPPGISNLDYMVDLFHARDCKLPEVETTELLRGFCL
ncbi:PD-(D/E)XK motif protein [Paracoccus hibiscisoli]|nr:PD-(D/E)XK motif protein [Paracoccus hibiscisoli]